MIINGRQIADAIIQELRERTSNLSFRPVFCDVLVGSDAVQKSYVNIKGRVAESIGLEFILQEYSEAIATEELLLKISKLNELPNLSGLIVQLPLPKSIDTARVLAAINPLVDVDVIGKRNVENFYSGASKFLPPTAAAILRILDSLEIYLGDKKFLVVGQGPLVGKPITYLLRSRAMHVTTADRLTHNMEELLQEADIIISGAGQPGLITGDKIKHGSIVIDAGTSEIDGDIKGDVDFDSVQKVAAWVSPVPGGVGPVTVAELLSNIVTVAEQLNQ